MVIQEIFSQVLLLSSWGSSRNKYWIMLHLNHPLVVSQCLLKVVGSITDISIWSFVSFKRNLTICNSLLWSIVSKIISFSLVMVPKAELKSVPVIYFFFHFLCFSYYSSICPYNITCTSFFEICTFKIQPALLDYSFCS